MVIVRLLGGLGNQMFQYAAARRLALKRGMPLKLDLSAFPSDPLRDFSLAPFNVQAQFATAQELAKVKGKSFAGRLESVLFRLRRKVTWTVMTEKGLSPFKPALLRASGNVYLAGYWQDERYFLDAADTIRADLTLKEALSPESRAVAGQIQSTESVSMHIRRGDYVSNPKTYRLHGVCSMAYYQQSVDLIAEKIAMPHFFIFSDDPGWVRDNFRLEHPATFVTHNGLDRDYEDLHLLSLCRHHIIANSSFSWWGAWLCSHPGKIVIAPRRWFNRPELQDFSPAPEDWIRL